MLMTVRSNREDEIAQEYLMKFIEAVQRNKTLLNKLHEMWREQMREKRRADKSAGDDIPQLDTARELEGI